MGITREYVPIVLLCLLALSELSDAFDGYLARKYNQVTDLGKILDPMADSISRFTYFLTFTASPVNVPLILIFIFFYRDLVISTLRTICALKGFALAARTSGKIKAGIQALAAVVILILMALQARDLVSAESLTYYSSWIVGLASIYTAYSGFDYIYANRQYIYKALSLNKI
jgi:CDP-diacylglycerol--glycerol-3-phosphate 3-phosphatidyltransferase